MTPRTRSRDAAAPLLVRVAGLPAGAVERLSTSLCAQLGPGAALEEELAAARAELVDRLHELVPGAPPALRRFVLEVKRDCHNGRPLARHLRSPGWTELREQAGASADRVPELEARLAAWTAAFGEAYRRERDRQRRLLVEHLGDRDFLRGLALSSPDLLWTGRRMRELPPEEFGRKEERAELALLRYVTRAAVKLSPFSTLTRVGLGRLGREGAAGAVELTGGDWGARSLVRVNRYLLDQYYAMLCMYPPFRDGLRVVLNDSVAEVAPGRFLFLRPSHWELDEARGTWGHVKDALVRTELRGPLVARLAELLARERLSYGELVPLLERELPGDAVPGQVGRLLRAGFLRLRAPWPVHEGHLEKRMLRHLRSLPADAGLERFAGLLERLVTLEEGYPGAGDPARWVREANGLIDELWRAAADLAGLPAEASFDRFRSDNVYEDVFLVPAPAEPATDGIVRLSRRSAEAALRSVEPLVRFSTLFSHRHELHLALADWAAERWPGRTEVGVLELFQEVQPLWREYLSFHLASRDGPRWSETWNPRGLPEVGALAGWRAEALAGLRASLRAEGDEQRMSGETLDAVLDRVPARYTTAPVGPCLFMQPATADGALWMVNRIKEGTGRFGSRYTPAMEEETRRWYTSWLASRSMLEADGEQLRLLDLRSVQGDTLNVHAPQTLSVLTLPGQDAGVPAHRRVSLGDLLVRFGGPERTPSLRGRDGERYLPVHLGVAYEDCMPTLVKFLSLFGPNELNAAFPPQSVRREGDTAVGDRTVLGSVVLHRRSWTAPVRSLAEEIAGATDAQAFAAVNRWRAARGIPDRVFVPERKPHPLLKRSFKPQYLDFTSPLFVPLLRSVLEAGAASLTLVEMLPTPDAFPADASGRRWAVEVLLDSLALRPGGSRVPVVEICAPAGRAEPTLAGG